MLSVLVAETGFAVPTKPLPQSKAAAKPRAAVEGAEGSEGAAENEPRAGADGGDAPAEVRGAEKASALAEEFRIVKRQILEAARHGGSGYARRVLVTSPHEDEGKTFCAVNLALSLAAERDLEVVLIDADIGNPSVKELFGLPSRAGLMDVLADPDCAVESHVLKTDIDGLWLLPPGRQTSHASEALASRRTAEMFERLTAQAPNRIVLVDSPPALAASPAAEIAKHVGQTILVARADRTGKTALEDAAQLLSACPDIKLVLNDANFSPSGRRFGSYYG